MNRTPTKGFTDPYANPLHQAWIYYKVLIVNKCLKYIYIILIIDKLLSFGYDPQKKTFFITTTDEEFVKMERESTDNPNKIIFYLDEKTVKQLCQYYSLYKMNKKPIDQEEDF